MAAFLAGVEAGYPLELDVHLLADGTVAVFHDDDLVRMTGVAGAVVACTRERLASLRLQGTSEVIPTFAAVLEAVAGRVPLLVELKRSSQPAGTLEAAVWAQLRTYRGPVAMQSFDPGALAWFRRHAPGIARGQLASNFRDTDLPGWQKVLLRNLAFTPWTRPHFVGYALQSLPHRAPNLLRQWGLPLLAWTIRAQEEYDRALSFADNVIFERIRPPLPAPRGAGDPPGT